jgi:hypothetical protein
LFHHRFLRSEISHIFLRVGEQALDAGSDMMTAWLSDYSNGMDDCKDILDKISAMAAQIPSYACRNYLVEVDDSFDANYRNSPVAVCDESYPFHGPSDACIIDREWRKRICEWMYKVSKPVEEGGCQ